LSPGVYLRLMARESRGSRGRLLFFVVCLAVGVAAVVAVAGLAASFERGVRADARTLLAADLVVESHRPLPAEIDRILERIPGAERSDVQEMATVVSAPGDDGDPGPSLLTELKVVGAGYPFYGQLHLQPERPLRELLDANGVVIAPEASSRLGLTTGDRLRIGGALFTVRGLVLSEPDHMSVSLTLGPRVFLSPDGLERAGLDRFGSHIEYRALVRLPDGGGAEAVRELARTFGDELPDAEYLRIETYADAQPGLRRGIERVERFLGLVALLSLLVGGLGVAQVVAAWIAGRVESIAVLRCLGMRPREALALYFGQTLLLAVAGSGAGIALGIAVQAVAPRILGDLLPLEYSDPWQPAAALRGLLLGIGVAALFSLRPLLSVQRVPPARVFRQEAEPLPAGHLASWGTLVVLVAGLFAVTGDQSGSARLAAGFVVGLIAAAALLAATVWAITRLMGAVSLHRVRISLRHGLAAAARPGAATLGATVALGLGVLVVTGMFLVQDGLARQLRAELPVDAPTAFLVDIQPPQWPGIRELLEQEGATRIDSAPVVVARLRAVDGRPVSELLGAQDDREAGHRRWVLTREQRMTYLERLPEDNQLLAGSLWSDPDHPEISIEQEFAGDLGATVGSTLGFDVQGVPLELRVTSVRSVEWSSFGINFFLVVEPGVLEQAPQVRVAAVRLPRGAEQAIQDRLAAQYPNVTLLRIREILEKLVVVLERIGLGVRLLGGFTVLAGVTILGGAISAGAVRRGREVALLKTLGMTRWGVAAAFSVEYAMVGLVAGLVGASGGALLAWAVLEHGMELDARIAPAAVVAAMGGATLLAVVAGLAASLRALSRRPVEVLRQE